MLLGRYDSPESKGEYERLLSAIRTATPVVSRALPLPPLLTVNELLLAFLGHCEAYYRRPDGSPTSEPRTYRLALRVVQQLFGPTPAAEFGPLALKAVRQRMADLGWSRGVVNQSVGRVRRCWKWAAEEELVPFEAFHRLTAVRGLARGRSAAREADPVGPVPMPVVLATLPRLNRHVAGMVRLQLLAGMRPGEACRFRLADTDTAGEVWTYIPPQHKTLHRGKVRRVKIGPQAQAVLAPFLGGDPELPLFSPRLARLERYAAMRIARKSKVQPSQADRSKAAPKKRLGPGYTVSGYSQAVAKAVGKENARRERLTGGGTSTRCRTGTRTSSGTWRPRTCGSGSGWRPPRCCSGTARRT